MRDVKNGLLVVLLDNGKAYSEEKQNDVGIHYITLHEFSIDRKNKTVTFKYWEHGTFNGHQSGVERTISFKDFGRAIKAQFSFGRNKEKLPDNWDTREPTLQEIETEKSRG